MFTITTGDLEQTSTITITVILHVINAITMTGNHVTSITSTTAKTHVTSTTSTTGKTHVTITTTTTAILHVTGTTTITGNHT